MTLDLSLDTVGTVALGLLLLWTGVQLGGGLYEKRVVIPLWATDPTPDTLSRRLAECGETGSATRFWPFVSPVVFLLAVLNMAFAWGYNGPARPWWLAAAAGFLLMSVGTYAYFVPTMISLMRRSHTYTPEKLSRTVSVWLNLSNVRLVIAVPAWLAALRAVTLIAGGAGGPA
jgi:hypothetical protein